MYLRGNQRARTSRFEDYRLGAAVGVILAAYAGFAFGLFWLMQPSVATNYGVAGYRAPPKTIVRSADAPWVPPETSEPLPIRAKAEPAAPAASVAEEPKKEAKKQEVRTVPRPARLVREQPNPYAVREQPNPYSGYAYSRSFGSRPF